MKDSENLKNRTTFWQQKVSVKKPFLAKKKQLKVYFVYLIINIFPSHVHLHYFSQQRNRCAA